MASPEKISIPEPGHPNRDIMVIRRTPAFERLVRAGTLNARHRMACERLYLAWATAEGVRLDEPLGLPMGSIPGWAKAGITDAQADAMSEYRDAMNALGPSQGAAVINVVLYDLTLEELAKGMRVRRDVAKGYLKAGADRLADFYELAHNPHERPLPQPWED